MMKTLVIRVYDSERCTWRSFAVVPFEPNYKPRCGNGLHQFWPDRVKCACGVITRSI